MGENRTNIQIDLLRFSLKEQFYMIKWNEWIPEMILDYSSGVVDSTSVNWCLIISLELQAMMVSSLL